MRDQSAYFSQVTKPVWFDRMDQTPVLTKQANCTSGEGPLHSDTATMRRLHKRLSGMVGCERGTCSEWMKMETSSKGFVMPPQYDKPLRSPFLSCSFLDRLKDVLKVFDHPVSPSWNENILLSEPQGLIVDVCVAGVSSEVDSQEKLPRAWVVLSEKGKRFGVENTIRELKKWHENNLNHYNRLTGGIEVVDEVSLGWQLFSGIRLTFGLNTK